MKKIFILVLLLFILSACTSNNNTTTNNKAAKLNITQDDLLPGCKMKNITLEGHLKQIEEADLNYTSEYKRLINQEYVDKFNNLPLCMSFCNGNIVDDNLDTETFCKHICSSELERSKRDDDWFAVDDLYEVCDSLGIILPR